MDTLERVRLSPDIVNVKEVWDMLLSIGLDLSAVWDISYNLILLNSKACHLLPSGGQARPAPVKKKRRN